MTVTAEELEWLPSVALALRRGRPADMDTTRRLLDIIDRLDRGERALENTFRWHDHHTDRLVVAWDDVRAAVRAEATREPSGPCIECGWHRDIWPEDSSARNAAYDRHNEHRHADAERARPPQAEGLREALDAGDRLAVHVQFGHGGVAGYRAEQDWRNARAALRAEATRDEGLARALHEGIEARLTMESDPSARRESIHAYIDVWLDAALATPPKESSDD